MERNVNLQKTPAFFPTGVGDFFASFCVFGDLNARPHRVFARNVSLIQDPVLVHSVNQRFSLQQTIEGANKKVTIKDQKTENSVLL